jgi:hypothetical protein
MMQGAITRDPVMLYGYLIGNETRPKAWNMGTMIDFNNGELWYYNGMDLPARFRCTTNEDDRLFRRIVQSVVRHSER